MARRNSAPGRKWRRWRPRKKAAIRIMAARKKAKAKKAKNPLGLPWWVVLGGAALGLFLLTRKASATKTTPSTQPGTNFLIQPTGGWGYPPMTTTSFNGWCKANSGQPLDAIGASEPTCMISGKGAYKLVNGRLKMGDEWVLNDDDLF